MRTRRMLSRSMALCMLLIGLTACGETATETSAPAATLPQVTDVAPTAPSSGGTTGDVSVTTTMTSTLPMSATMAMGSPTMAMGSPTVGAITVTPAPQATPCPTAAVTATATIAPQATGTVTATVTPQVTATVSATATISGTATVSPTTTAGLDPCAAQFQGIISDDTSGGPDGTATTAAPAATDAAATPAVTVTP